jgi:hypothetical protein
VPVWGAFAGLILVVVAALYAVVADRLVPASDRPSGRRR